MDIIKNKIMKQLLSIMLVLLSVVALAQKPKVLRVKAYKDGKIVGIKTYNIVQPINVTQFKYLPPKVKIVQSKPKIVKVPEYKIVEVPGKPTALDTVAILQQYYPKNTFKDVLVLPEKQGTVSVTDTISQNRLVGRSWVANVKPKVVEVVREVQAPKVREWYVGPELTTNFRNIYNWYGANVLLKNKSNNIYKFGAGITMRDERNSPLPFISLGAYIKIK
jgi:hypothetical protein